MNLIKIANTAMVLLIAGSLCLLLLFSLNCSSPTDQGHLTPLLSRDSMAVETILRANGKSWKKTNPPVGRNEEGRITSLFLSALGLDTIPPAIGDLDALDYLDLSGNRIRALPSRIERLTELTNLNLHGNRLVSLPDGLRYPQLENIDLSNNKLTSLPLNLDVTHLKVLYLDSNLITSLPPDFKYLTMLWLFSIRDNRLDSLPGNISDLASLGRLEVSGNGLKSLPTSLMELNFKYLDVGRNKLCSPGAEQSDSTWAAMKIWLDSVDRDWRSTQTCN